VTATRSAKILVVEDDRVVARDLQQQLTRIGHSVVAVTARGEDAVRLALETKPELALMDIRLEGSIDGIEAARQLGERCRVPVIYLTAYADDQTLARAALTEPFGYLLKPFDDTQLRTAVEIALYKHDAERRLRESERRYAVTLASIGDAIIATDHQAKVTFMNPVAEALTGFSFAEAAGRPLPDVFRIVNESTREPVEDPAAKVLRLGAVVGLANHTVLMARGGREVPIDDSGAPIVDDSGAIVGVVLVFRDITERRKAEQAEVLHAANSRLELALRGTDTGIWDFQLKDGVIDRTGGFYSFNAWAGLGYDEPEKKSIEDRAKLWHPDDRASANQAIAACLSGEDNRFEVEVRVLHKDGAYRWMLSRGAVLRDENGLPTRFIGITTNISDRKFAEQRLSELNERVDRALRGSNICLWEVAFSDIEGAPPAVFISNLWEQLGYESGAFDDDYGALVALNHPEDQPMLLAKMRAYLGGAMQEYETESRVRRKDGLYRWMLTRAVAVRDPQGRPRRLIGTTVDITERKRLEENLRYAKDAAEAANRAKDEFLANVSHEIRTPMNAILGMTELVLDTPLSQGQRQSLKTVQSAASSLLGTINDLLDFSKIEAGKLELDLTDFSLRATLSDTLRALAVRAHRKGLELVCDVHPDVPDALIGDPGRLRQVWLNLVGNAIKFTSQGEVIVRVDLADVPSDPPERVSLRFTVRDTGIGIPVEKQETIFRAFEQEDTSTTRKYGGTGLGLTIAARLAALMGGAIGVESEPRRGSTFTFVGEFGRRERSEAPRSVPALLELRGLRTLVVDDNAANRHILEEWLQGWQLDVTAVGDGLAAMDALWHGVASRRPYALALVDAHMPDTDGLTLAAKIRERAELAATRIVLLTSGDRPGDLARIRELRVDAYLLKPIPQEELLETIHSVMGRTEDEALAPSPELPPVVQERVTTPRERPLRILIAEDNDFNSQLLVQLLGKRGHSTRVAETGAQTLSLSASEQFDLVLLDLHMPELDGFQVVHALRERERGTGKRLPVIAVTARSRPEDRERCLAAGMDDFLAKPLVATELWAAIHRASRDQPKPSLLSSQVLLAVCGGDAAILAKVRAALHARLPDDLRALEAAVRTGDGAASRDRAHKLAGMISAFSTAAGDVATEVAERAELGDLGEAAKLVETLQVMSLELLELTRELTLDDLSQSEP
jgi:PAS domain S-box-containing protein